MITWKQPLVLCLAPFIFLFSGCQDADNEGRELTGPPTPDFSVSNANCRAPCQVEFTSLVDNAESYIWSFGDGDTSSQVNPTHIYEEKGFYSVSLKVTNESGSEVIVKEIRIDTGFNKAAVESITLRDFPETDTNSTRWDPNSPPDLYVELQKDPDSLIISNSTVFPNVVDTLDLPLSWNFTQPLPMITDFEQGHTFRLIDQDSNMPDRTMVSYALPMENLKAAPEPYPDEVPILNDEEANIGSINLDWRQ